MLFDLWRLFFVRRTVFPFYYLFNDIKILIYLVKHTFRIVLSLCTNTQVRLVIKCDDDDYDSDAVSVVFAVLVIVEKVSVNIVHEYGKFIEMFAEDELLLHDEEW